MGDYGALLARVADAERCAEEDRGDIEECLDMLSVCLPKFDNLEAQILESQKASEGRCGELCSELRESVARVQAQVEVLSSRAAAEPKPSMFNEQMLTNMAMDVVASKSKADTATQSARALHSKVEDIGECFSDVMERCDAHGERIDALAAAQEKQRKQRGGSDDTVLQKMALLESLVETRGKELEAQRKQLEHLGNTVARTARAQEKSAIPVPAGGGAGERALKKFEETAAAQNQRIDEKHEQLEWLCTRLDRKFAAEIKGHTTCMEDMYTHFGAEITKLSEMHEALGAKLTKPPPQVSKERTEIRRLAVRPPRLALERLRPRRPLRPACEHRFFCVGRTGLPPF